MFLEIHQPIRHLQVGHVVDSAIVAKRRGIFAVRIDHHDVPLWRHFADPVQDQRSGGRLARAGRTEQREMLAQHGVDIQRRPDVAGRIDVPDLDVRAPFGGIDLAQIAAGDGIHLGARRRIARHAAPELIKLARQLFLVALAEKIDRGGDPPGAQVLQPQRAYVGDQPRRADAHLDLAAHLAARRDHRIGMGGERRQRGGIQQHLAARAGNLGHDPDRLQIGHAAAVARNRSDCLLERLLRRHFTHRGFLRAFPSRLV